MTFIAAFLRQNTAVAIADRAFYRRSCGAWVPFADGDKMYPLWDGLLFSGALFGITRRIHAALTKCQPDDLVRIRRNVRSLQPEFDALLAQTTGDELSHHQRPDQWVVLMDGAPLRWRRLDWRTGELADLPDGLVVMFPAGVDAERFTVSKNAVLSRPTGDSRGCAADLVRLFGEVVTAYPACPAGRTLNVAFVNQNGAAIMSPGPWDQLFPSPELNT